MQSFEKAKSFYRRHERWMPITFFGIGFVFDAVMLKRIDEFAVLLQQALYIVVSGVLIAIELVEGTREIQAPKILIKVWKYREAFFHFLLGTLLNSYTIFYFKSASTLTSLAFISLLVLLLIINEFKRFGKSQSRVHMAFWSLSVASYLVVLVPIMIGFIGTLPFLLGISLACFVFMVFYQLIRPYLASTSGYLRRHVVLPFFLIQFAFVGLYFAHAIPPVPLSVKYIGIFHNVTKLDGDYELTFTRPDWKFWQNGDQTFLARPGDEIFCFVKVFSPSRISDRLQVRWLFKDPTQGWLSQDAIAMNFEGGREEGYRGVTKKSNFQPGHWRVQIETTEDREVGRISFEVESDKSTDERILTKITH